MNTTDNISIVHDATPEFGDFRVAGKMFSFSRATLYRLLAEGKIKSACLRERGKTRGRRLFYLPSIREYLFAHMEGGAQ